MSFPGDRGERFPQLGPRKPLQIPKRIDGRAVDPNLEMQMRAEAVPRAPDVADHLALRDAAATDGERRLVRVRRRETAAVVDDREVPVAAHPAGEDDGTARRRGNGGPV